MPNLKSCKSDSVRRVAAHHVIVKDKDCGRCVVVFNPDGTVLDIHSLTQEEPFTEWLGGTLVIDDKPFTIDNNQQTIDKQQ